jgi:cell division protein FtsA
LASENQENEIVSIPGLRGRPHKEISIKNLSAIIQARMEEIIEHVYFEIKNSGFEKKLIAGIVVTGGGAQLKHIKQLVEYITGMDVRIGYPNEHLASGSEEGITSPMYATAVGLIMKGLEKSEQKKSKKTSIEMPEAKEEKPHHEPSVKGGTKSNSTSFFDKMKKFFDEDTEAAN